MSVGKKFTHFRKKIPGFFFGCLVGFEWVFCSRGSLGLRTGSPYMSWMAYTIDYSCICADTGKDEFWFRQRKLLCRRTTNYKCSSRGINVLAILNSGQKLSLNALRSASPPALDINPM